MFRKAEMIIENRKKQEDQNPRSPQAGKEMCYLTT
jgi:hypothetical protein